jgi:hypothetical protein
LYALSVSEQATRSGAFSLNGATVSGAVYVFTSSAAQITNFNPSGIATVSYWLDNPTMSGAPVHSEGLTPYDFAGSVDNTATGTANPWSTATLADGIHRITQLVTKSSGGTEIETATFIVLNAVASPVITPLKITTSSLPSATISAGYSAALTASGGTAPYTWTIVSGSMGSGLTLATNGAISGTPAAAGQDTFSVQVKDSAATPQAATASLILTVSSLAPSITTTSLPSGTVNQAYSAALAGKNGTAPYSWTMTSGQLAGGLSFASSGAITGKPTVAGAFPITVELIDSTGRTASAALSLVIAASAPTTSTGFLKFFSATSFWNTPIAANPAIDPSSSADVQASLVNYESSANFSNGAYGEPLAYAHSTDKVYSVACTLYSSPTCSVGGSIQFPIPAGTAVATGSDHHLAVVYEASDDSPYAGKELDIWEASYDSSNDTWSGDTVVLEDAFGTGLTCPVGQHCGSAVAAGWPLLGGAVRPEEIAQGHIDHALAISTPYNLINYIACPASHTDGSASGPALPEGALIQLDPSINVSAQSWPQWIKVIAQALQTYGAYDRDFGGSIAVFGVTDQNAGVPSWSSVGVTTGGSLSDIPWGSMRVMQIKSCN